MNFLHQRPFYVATYSIGYIGGAILFAGGFSKYKIPHWVRVAFWMAGPTCLAWATLGFTLLFDSSLSPIARRALLLDKAVASGANLGILLLIMFSGELFHRWKR